MFVCTLNIQKRLTISKPIKHNLRFVKCQPIPYISNVETDIGLPTPYPYPSLYTPTPITPYSHPSLYSCLVGGHGLLSKMPKIFWTSQCPPPKCLQFPHKKRGEGVFFPPTPKTKKISGKIFEFPQRGSSIFLPIIL